MQINPGLHGRHLQFYSYSLHQTPAACVVEGIEIRRASMTDLMRCLFQGEPPVSLKRRFLRGDEYFIASAGRLVVGIGRICYTATDEIVIDQKEASLISFWVNPQYRGRGIYVGLIHEMLRALRKRGFYTAYIWADRHNEPSVRGIEKSGFRRLEQPSVAS